jgi:hypothetical protein
MIVRKSLLLLAVPAILLLDLSAALAEWRPQQRTAFMNDCVAACRENSKVSPGEKALCGSACGCVMSEAEKFMTPADFDAATAAIAQGKSSAMLDRVNALIPICNRRTFGP